MVNKVFIYNIKTFAKWEEKLNTPIDWEKVCKRIKTIKEIKFEWFQLRVCYRILVNNVLLKDMKVTDTDKCNFCEKERDSIQHYLWEYTTCIY